MKHFFVLISLAIILLVGIVTAPMQPNPTTIALERTQPTNGLLTGKWHAMPGMDKLSEGGFTIHPMEFALVEQDDSFAQANPSIHLVGTHLDKVGGDFAVNATLKPLKSTAATIQLYGKPPIIADEFRVERESIRITVANGKITITLWKGLNQNPLTRTYAYTPKETLNLSIARKSNLLVFTVNKVHVGSIPESGVFRSGQVWFGFDAKGSNWQLTNLNFTSTPSSPLDTSRVFDSSKLMITQHDQNGLQRLASQKRPEFIVGAAQALGPLVSDQQYRNIAMDNHMLGSWTPENLMKMINIQPQKGVYTFAYADGLVHLAQQNGITMHGHALVFGEANPPWFNALPTSTTADKQTIEHVMLDHITNVVGHFKGKVASWDVINEPMADYDDTPNGEGATLRKHKWYKAMGQRYISKALIAAHRVDPDAILFINEYGLETDGDRWDAFVTLLQQIKLQVEAEGVPTDKLGVGFQAHIYERGDKIDTATLRRHIRQLETLGFKTQISEMDVYIEDGDTVQAQQYTNVFKACLEEKNCIAWRGWILSDRYNYFKDDDGSIQTGEDGLFGTDMKPRPAFESIKQLLIQ